MGKIDLTGEWGFCLDRNKEGIKGVYFKKDFIDTIVLPATVSTAQKTVPYSEAVKSMSYLTDPYYFEGYTWYSRWVELTEIKDKEFFLVFERTRVSRVWIDEEYIGSCSSLCTSHRYRITPNVHKKIKITVMIDNTSYPVKGGHMTSPDTQTNWNGITGQLYLEEFSSVYISNVRIYPDAANMRIRVRVILHGVLKGRIRAVVQDEKAVFSEREFSLAEGENCFYYQLDETVNTWSEHTPYLYRLKLQLIEAGDASGGKEEYSYSFGLRDFKAAGRYFEINGARTFLRGKHDGLIFPLTGYAPTDTCSWIKVLGTAKEYGINHYRFHTCCPPKACFEAADLLGVYLEPELPFWGTVAEEGEDKQEETAREYLIREGFRILDEFGNHPSFVMMSLGNELWGSRSVLNKILGQYKLYDDRHLYTQGSNNFQFMPCILENDDFFCGVRFSADRLFRGSYAMCDAPQGHIQTMSPNSVYNYDAFLRPDIVRRETGEACEIAIQYGFGTKTVKMDAAAELIPAIPVLSHEIGQYAMYPDFSEINRYTGVLKAENLKLFKERLCDKGMLPMADKFFKASGRFAADCYKAEIEAALRSRELAGFQLLDLQDFTGQGTALVGILNAFMENKGIISDKKWRQFCSDTVIMAELPGLVFTGGEEVNIGIKLAVFKPEAVAAPTVCLTLSDGGGMIQKLKYNLQYDCRSGVYKLCDFTLTMPKYQTPCKLLLHIGIDNTDIVNCYELWVYPEMEGIPADKNTLITENISEAAEYLKGGRNVLLYLEDLKEDNSIQGTYCTDFWCYPMFRSISESMGKPVPIGTHGLFIDKNHKIFRDFPSEFYSTAQWYDIVTDSRALILDERDIEPIVYTIDNFERNHKLGNLFEVRAGKGKLLVSTFHLSKKSKYLPARWLEYSILKYAASDDFQPVHQISLKRLMELF